MSPSVFNLSMSLRDGHLQRRVGHFKWDKLLPVFRPRQSPCGRKPLVKRRRRQGREQAKDGQPWGPSANLLQRPLRDPGRVVVHAEDEGGDRINIALGEPLEHGCILTRLVEPLVYARKVRRVDGLHADENPLATRGGNEVNEFFVAQQISADLSDPVYLRVGGDNVAQQRLRALDIDGKVVVDEKNGDLTPLAPGARFQQQQLIHDAFVRAKPDGVAEKAGYRAELAPVRTPAPGFDWNNAECPPSGPETLEHAFRDLWDQIELIEVDRIPRDRGIWLERGFTLLAKLIHGSVDILEFAAHSIRNDLRPGLIGFTEGHGVRVARSAVSTEGLIGLLRNVRAAHHDRHTYGTDGIRHTVGLCDHSGHRTNADESNVVFAHVPRDTLFIHRLCIPINQQHLMPRWRQRLQQKHPKMRHKIARDAVVGIVE